MDIQKDINQKKKKKKKTFISYKDQKCLFFAFWNHEALTLTKL
jgi:hypothetical protein